MSLNIDFDKDFDKISGLPRIDSSYPSAYERSVLDYRSSTEYLANKSLICFDILKTHRSSTEYLANKSLIDICFDILKAQEIENLKNIIQSNFGFPIESISEFKSHDEESKKCVLIFNTGLDFSQEQVVEIDDRAYSLFAENDYKTIEAIMIL